MCGTYVEETLKKFILLNSPIFWDATTEKEPYLSPLGLGYIATYLEKSNIEVEILDCVKKQLPVAEILQYINNSKPDYVGINIFTQNYDIVKYIIENIEINCECFVGGQVVKCIYQDLLSWNSNNTLNIVIGEGEFIIPAIVTGKCVELPMMIENNKKIYRVDKNSVYFPNDISNLSLNRKFLSDEIVVNHYGEKEGAIITSRGCAFDCAFCGGAKSLNKDVTIRTRSEESVVEEIRKMLTLYPDIQSVRILDDLFLRNASSIDMSYRIFSNFPQLKWRGMVHALSLIKALDKISKLRNSNCRELFIGIESGSDRIRKKINKLGTTEEIIKVATEILCNGIDLKGYFIYGFPQETEEDYKKTYSLAKELKEISGRTDGNFRTSVFQFRPYQGTQLYNEIIGSMGIIHECKINQEISRFKGRTQFNFDFGNYSLTSDEVLNEYIIKTQEI
jgi:radical SAM superfamily enzyme YgiQ (UPF0313 family)